jgi:hypothetical protein
MPAPPQLMGSNGGAPYRRECEYLTVISRLESILVQHLPYWLNGYRKIKILKFYFILFSTLCSHAREEQY